MSVIFPVVMGVVGLFYVTSKTLISLDAWLQQRRKRKRKTMRVRTTAPLTVQKSSATESSVLVKARSAILASRLPEIDFTEHPDSPEESDHSDLSRNGSSGARLVITYGAHFPRTLRRRLTRLLAEDADENIRIGVACNPITPPSVLAHLFRSNATAASYVLRNPSCPAEILKSTLAYDAPDYDESLRTLWRRAPAEQRYHSRNAYVRYDLASDPAAGAEYLTLLANDSAVVATGSHTSDSIQRVVAANPGTPATTLEALAVHCSSKPDDWRTRNLYESLGRNPSSPESVLRLLVRILPEDVAKHSNTSANLLALLLSNESVRARIDAACHCRFEELSGCDIDLTEALVIRRVASTHTSAEVLIELSRHESPAVRQSLAHNVSAPAEALLNLARDGEVGIRRTIARRDDLSTELQNVLAKDADKWVRAYLSWSNRLNAAAVAILKNDPDKYIRESMNVRESPGAHAARLINTSESEPDSAQLIERVTAADAATAPRLAKNPALPWVDIVKLAGITGWP